MIADPVRVAVGAPVALAAAASFGISSILQYRATHQVPREPVGRPKLLLDLAHQRNWRWSVVLAVLAFALQVLALKLIPLILVQPLLVTGLLWYVLLSAALEHRRPDPVILVGSLLCLGGLSGFLLLAQPSPNAGRGLDSLRAALPLGIGIGAALAACLGAAAAVGRRWRALPLALATGILYGTTAGLVSSLSAYFSGGLGAVLAHWQTYAIVVCAPVGVLLSQNAYQAGRLGSPALAIMTVTDPLVAIAIGLVWLSERVAHDTAHIAGEAVSLVVLVAAVFLLARRAPHVRAGGSAEQWPERTRGKADRQRQRAEQRGPGDQRGVGRAEGLPSGEGTRGARVEAARVHGRGQPGAPAYRDHEQPERRRGEQP